MMNAVGAGSCAGGWLDGNLLKSKHMPWVPWVPWVYRAPTRVNIHMRHEPRNFFPRARENTHGTHGTHGISRYINSLLTVKPTASDPAQPAGEE